LGPVGTDDRRLDGTGDRGHARHGRRGSWRACARPGPFLPAIAVASDGRVGLTYYDFRTLAPDNTTTLPTDIWFKSAARSGNLATAAETHVTGPFNFLAAPNAGGFFLGDYEGLAANGTSFVGVDDITNCNTASCGSNPTDTYAFGLP
jgi:hypothetical protein